MRLSFHCPSCTSSNRVVRPLRVEILEENRISCPVCCSNFDVSESIRKSKVVDKCCVCGFEKFYVQKDFNKFLGLGIVGISILFSYHTYLMSLFAGALLDWILYRTRPEVTICYKCKAKYGDFVKNPDHGPFDLYTADKAEGRY